MKVGHMNVDHTIIMIAIRFRVFYVPGVVPDRNQTHSPSCDLRNAIALIAHTYVRGSYDNT
jgi:hypothetical protein